MSSLLERAIVDATALKDAALKSAEKLVIEKYSHEVKTAVDSLLSSHFEEGKDNINEQGLELPGMGGADPLAMEPTGDPDPTAGLGGLGDPADPTANAEAEEGQAEEQEPLDPEDLISLVPDAFLADDDEIIKIKLDSLEAEMEDEPDDIRFGGDEEMSDDEIGIEIEDDLEDLEIEEDLQEPTSAPGIGIDITPEMMSELLSHIEINHEDEEEIDLEELMEKVRVDFEPQKSGWAGTPEVIMKEYEAMLLAKEQDTETKEENEELRKTVAALKQENKTIVSAATKLQKENKKYETAFDTLQEKLETMNVSNAKLLYINQALENASLNERQKRKIVEAISKAETVQEAKIIFDTMSNAVTTTLDAKKDVTLNEVVSRKSSLLVAARKEQKNTNANPMFDRLQKLAGIKTE